MSFAKAPNFLGNLFTAEMSGRKNGLFRFGSYLLDAAERELLKSGEAIPLSPKSFDTLLYLVRNSGHLVTKDELMSAVWPDSFVEEGNVSRTIHVLRKTLGEGENGNQFIKTVPTRGYKFVADVEVLYDVPEKTLAGRADAAHQMLNGQIETPPDYEASDPEETRRPVPPPKSRSTFWIAAVLLLAALVTGLSFEKDKIGSLSLGKLLRQTRNGKAYQSFQQGRLFVERHQDGDFKAALEYFDKAIDLDPDYAEAYAGRADARIRIFWVSGATGDTSRAGAGIDDISLASAAIDKALELDNSSSYAHTMRCRLHGAVHWQFALAEKECRWAIELDPNDQGARRELGFLLNSVGRQDEALAEMDNAVALAPTSYNKQSRGVILYFLRRYDDAIEQLKQVEDTDPEFWFGVPFLLDAYEMKGDAQGAFQCYLRMRKAKGANADENESVRAAFTSGGWPAVLKFMANEPKQNGFQLAGTFAQLGEYDKAIEVLNALADRRQVWTVHTAREPRFDPLRSDPRFQALLRRMGLE